MTSKTMKSSGNPTNRAHIERGLCGPRAVGFVPSIPWNLPISRVRRLPDRWVSDLKAQHLNQISESPAIHESMGPRRQGRVSFPIHDMSGGESSSMVLALYGNLPEA